MDYEKKYNEILAWAKKYKARLNGVPIEDIFPELRESDDERIRKYLIDFVGLSDNPRKGDCDRAVKFAFWKFVVVWMQAEGVCVKTCEEQENTPGHAGGKEIVLGMARNDKKVL